MEEAWSNQAHHKSMTHIWSYIINLSVFVVLYKYKPLWMIAHVILGFGIGFFTLLFALPILRLNGIPSVQTPGKWQRHKIMGTIALGIIIIQILLGITANVMKMFKNGSTTGIYFFNTCHKYLGYASVIYIKVQTYLTI